MREIFIPNKIAFQLPDLPFGYRSMYGITEGIRPILVHNLRVQL